MKRNTRLYFGLCHVIFEIFVKVGTWYIIIKKHKCCSNMRTPLLGVVIFCYRDVDHIFGLIGNNIKHYVT